MEKRSIEPLYTLTGHTAPVLTLQSSHSYPISQTPLGKDVLVSGSEDRTVRFWDLRTKRVPRAIKGFSDSVVSLTFHEKPSEAYKFFVASANKVKVFDIRRTDLILHDPTDSIGEFTMGEEEISQLALNNDGSLLSVANDDGNLYLNQLQNNHIKSFKGHQNIVAATTFHPNGKEFASGGMDKFIKTWDFHSLKKTWNLEDNVTVAGDDSSPAGVNPKFACCLAYSPSGTYLAGGLGDGNVRLFNLTSTSKKKSKSKSQPKVSGWDQIDLPYPHTHMVSNLLFLPSDSDSHPQLLSGSTDGTLRLWSLPPNLSSLTATPSLDPPLAYQLDSHLAKINDLCPLTHPHHLAITGTYRPPTLAGTIGIYPLDL